MMELDVVLNADISTYTHEWEDGDMVARVRLRPDIKEWCDANVSYWETLMVDSPDPQRDNKRWMRRVVRFRNDRDAVLFKTFWL